MWSVMCLDLDVRPTDLFEPAQERQPWRPRGGRVVDDVYYPERRGVSQETAEPLLDDEQKLPTGIELVDFAEQPVATTSLECVLSWEGFFADRAAAVTPLSSWDGVVSREVSGELRLVRYSPERAGDDDDDEFAGAVVVVPFDQARGIDEIAHFAFSRGAEACLVAYDPPPLAVGDEVLLNPNIEVGSGCHPLDAWQRLAPRPEIRGIDRHNLSGANCVVREARLAAQLRERRRRLPAWVRAAPPPRPARRAPPWARMLRLFGFTDEQLLPAALAPTAARRARARRRAPRRDDLDRDGRRCSPGAPRRAALPRRAGVADADHLRRVRGRRGRRA